MLNVVALMGRLTADPELKTTQSGLSVCRFTIAVDRNYAKAGTERQTDFISCVAWRGTADFISKYFIKGQLIALDGSIQTGSYTDNNGQKRYTFDVQVNNVNFTGDRRDGNNARSSGYSPAPQQNAAPSYSSGSASDFQDMPLDDDLPF
ncbi:MAG: single-stranded DNA-binding protein [Lachnospiraceae bacterium]|nr:single-stranded DNA-binding protein [Lachnospiraceae bacterium]